MVRETTYELVRELATPLVEQGLARLDWTEANPRDEWLAGGAVTLVPANDEAASVEVVPGPAWVNLGLGPHGNSHEVVIDKEGQWERHLRACVEAVIEGRYRESASPGRISPRVVTMTFEMPAKADIVVKHHVLYELEADEEEPPAERHFASYS